MPSQVVMQFIYPKSAASSFNLEYYLSHHWPLVEKVWGPQGLVNWSVTTGDKDSDYHVQAVIFWESMEAVEKLTGVEEIMGDVPKFTDVMPTKWLGTVVGRSVGK